METKRRESNNVNVLAITLAFVAVIITIGLILLSLISKDVQMSFMISTVGYVLLMFGLVYVYIYYFNKDLINHKNKLLLFLFINIIFIIATVFMIGLPYLLIPIPIAGMLVSVMIDTRLGIITNFFITIVGAILSTFGMPFILFYLISGSLSCLIITQAKERQKIVNVAIYLIIINGLLVLFNHLYQVGDFTELRLQDLLYAILNSAISIVITIGSLPLWETLFDVVTPLKLLELTNSDQKLIQRLLLEAPGTYHHSHMVSNLAETASTDIGGNALLARTGALYHDIGKLKNPTYFTENQNGHNPHDDLDPESSAGIIISHVSHGLKLATEYRLPKTIKNIIIQHQGDSLVRYFYSKAKDNSDGFEIDKSLYRYSGPKPLSNEAAIVMLADCVEAYVRSLPEVDRTLENIEKIIDEIINSKFEEGQLNECELKIRELPVIASSFMKVYNGMYHERIKYPDNKFEGESSNVDNHQQ